MTSKFALVIANTDYQDASFAKLTAPGKDAEEFAQVLRDAELAAFDDVQVLLNEGEGKTRRAIARFFADRKPTDLLLLYFSGHGVRSEQGQLFLAANDTEMNILEASGIPAEFITRAMNVSRSQRQLLILDCCNSGSFAYGSKSASAVGKTMGIASAFEGDGYGRVVLTATDATQYAWEGDKVIGNTQKSVFTHFLIEGLKGNADRDGDGRIHVDELYDYAYEQVVHWTPKQTPGKWSYKQQGDIILRENLQTRDVQPAPLPSDFLELLSHPNSGVRKAGVQDLTSLLEGKHLGLARAAEEKLREIADNDDSLTLRKIAIDTLIAHGITLEQPIAAPKEGHSGVKPAPVEISKKEYKEEKKVEKPARIAIPSLGKDRVRERTPRPFPDWRGITSRATPRILRGVVIAVLGIALAIWGGSALLNNLLVPAPEPTPTLGLTATQPSQPAETNTPTPTKTPVPPTPTLGVGSSIISDKDGMTLLYVPAGEFTMGSDNGEANEQPVHKVTLDAFWIDQTEVTNAMFAKFMDETGHISDAEKAGKSWVYQEGDWKLVDGADWSHPVGPSSGISDIMNHPVVHVSWNDAQAYCSWANRRLPTEAEWEKAASWDDRNQQKYVYPWGNEFNGNVLNFCDKNCSFGWADKNSDDGYEFTAPVGTYSNGASPYGVLDLAGNVWEWVQDWYDAYPGNTVSDPDYGTTHRVLRGGSFYRGVDGVQSALRNWGDPAAPSYHVGFRCSRSP